LLRTSAHELTSFCQTLLTELLQHMRAIEERVHFIEASIQSFLKGSALYGKIAEIHGIGPITATAVVAAVGDAKQFRNGRHLSAGWASCLAGIRPAVSPACTASADASTHSCGPCSFMALELVCVMHRKRLILRRHGTP
jgi:transposase